MIINFVKINPTQNMTVLVKDNLSRDLHKSVAEKLMDYDNIFAEQVGFIETAGDSRACARLQMMGNEFCGNALMSLAAYIAWEQGAEDGDCHDIVLEASGYSGLIACKITGENGFYKGKLAMPVPKNIENVELSVDRENNRKVCLTKVSLPGIDHFIVDEAIIGMEKCDFVDKFLDLVKKETVCDAFGIIFFNANTYFMTPLIYVEPTKSKVWERGCGSGTAALASYIAVKTGKSLDMVVKQPGGAINAYVSLKNNTEVEAVLIEGFVKIVAEGKAYIY